MSVSKSDMGFGAVVLAAGRGSRMGSDLPKVLLPVAGKPIAQHVLDLLTGCGIERPVVVVGVGAALVREALGDRYEYAHQDKQLGSGHAVVCARDVARGPERLIVMCGDSPLFRPETVRALMEQHVSSGAAVSLVSAVLDDPSGYGRIIRGADGEIHGVVEEKLASPEEKTIREINGGCYAFDAEWLWAGLDRMSRNEAGEYCLTEMVDIAISDGLRVTAVPCSPDEVAGINTPEQLAAAERILLSR